MRRHIVIAKIFDFGGSNTHLRAVFRYMGEENIVLVLENEGQLKMLEKIGAPGGAVVKVMPKLHAYAHFQYRTGTNIREFIQVFRSILTISWLALRYGSSDVTINAVEPERLLYLLWLPFLKVNYFLHSTPHDRYTFFTPWTCNKRLGKKRRIITVSNANRETIISKWQLSEKSRPFINVVYNCPLDIADYEKKRHPQKGQYMILTMGHLIAYKNPQLWMDVALEVTRAHPGVNFTWIGDGPQFSELSARVKGNDRIRFIGAKKDITDFLREADIYYQPSLYETLGIAVLEAMACGLPCVVTRVGGLPETVNDGESGILVDPLDKRGHIDALLALLDDGDYRQQLGENAFQRYQEKFTYASFGAAMDQIYNCA